MGLVMVPKTKLAWMIFFFGKCTKLVVLSSVTVGEYLTSK